MEDASAASSEIVDCSQYIAPGEECIKQLALTGQFSILFILYMCQISYLVAKLYWKVFPSTGCTTVPDSAKFFVPSSYFYVLIILITGGHFEARKVCDSGV